MDKQAQGDDGAFRNVGEAGGETDATFLPTSPPRPTAESVVVRLVATGGVIGIGTAIGAVVTAAGTAGWITSLIVATVSVILAALLWRSRTL